MDLRVSSSCLLQSVLPTFLFFSQNQNEHSKSFVIVVDMCGSALFSLPTEVLPLRRVPKDLDFLQLKGLAFFTLWGQRGLGGVTCKRFLLLTNTGVTLQHFLSL